MYDVAIIGLGPAGAFLARYLSRDFRAIAIDKKLPQGECGFHKPCGGLLAPDAQKAFSRFHMTLPVELLVDPQIFSVRTIDLASGLVRHYQRHYINLNRHRFDQWLLGMVPDAIEVHVDACCTGVSREEGGYAVTYAQDGSVHTIHTKYVVGADGANSIVRRELYPQFAIRRYLSIQQWFADTHPSPFYSCMFDPSLTDSYAWGLTKDSHFILGGAFHAATAKRDFAALKQKLAAYGFRLDAPLKTEACMVLRPGGPRSFCYGKDGAFLIGEAAGFISPSSLEGISYAIDSGYLLSQCLNDLTSNPNRAYRFGTRKIRLKLAGKTLKRPFMYHPLLRKCVMKSGLTAIPVLPLPE